MITRSIALALLASVMVGGAAVNRAQALVTGPATASLVFTGDETFTNARWVCGPSRCEWHAWGGWGPRQSRSSNWGPPRTWGCFWEKNRRGQWRERCPR